MATDWWKPGIMDGERRCGESEFQTTGAVIGDMSITYMNDQS